MGDCEDIRQLKESLADLRSIMEDANVGTWRIEMSEDRLPRMQMDDMLCRFLSIDVKGLCPEDIYEKWLSKVRKADLPNIRSTIREMMQYGKAESYFIINHDTMGEQYVRWGGRSRHVKGQGYVLTGYQKIVTDVMAQIRSGKAEVAKAMRVAENAKLEKSFFFSDLSKDVAYSMECLKGQLAILDDEVQGNASLEAMGQVVNYVQDVMGAVCGMMDPNHYAERIYHEPVDLHSIVRSVKGTLRGLVKGSHLQTLSDNIQITHNMVIADPVRIRRIMTFLIARAMIVTAGGGKVEVHVHEEPCNKEGCILFVARVSDDGQELTEERGAENRVLGFEVVQNMVQQLEGSMHVERLPQKGTYVNVSIPILVDYEASFPSVQEDKVCSLKGRRVLVAEDNEICCQLLVQMLHEFGVEAEAVSDGRQCVIQMEAHEPSYYDAILMDIQMPVMDGYEASRTIREMEDEKKAFIPIVAVTANNFSDDVAKAIDSGMTAFIGKPVEAEVLLDTLENLIH